MEGRLRDMEESMIINTYVIKVPKQLQNRLCNGQEFSRNNIRMLTCTSRTQ
jgi:hypothetical protein